MNQNEINNNWLKTVPTNVGECTFITPPVRVVPGLRKPYECEIPAAEGKQLVKELKDMFSNLESASLQCVLVESKPTKYGIRLNIFLLGHRPDFCGEPHKGCNAQFWNVTTEWLATKLRETLGDWVQVYAEPWSADEKFQARFETYIKYSEL